jgi:hypothetical protein
MAEPPHGYGPYLYHPAATYPAPSGPPNNPSPYYPPAPTGAMPPTNYTTSQIAYEYNSNRIPGLGLSGPPMASGSLPPGGPPVWHNQGHTSQVNNQFQAQYQAPDSSTKSQPLPHHSNKTLEEGELSEGESEDIYEPRHSTNVSQATPHDLTHNADSRDGSAGDADGSSIYDPRDPQGSKDENAQTASRKTQGRMEQSPPDDEWEPLYPDRERSGSYSPYLSPREVHRRISVAKSAPSNDKRTYSKFHLSNEPNSNNHQQITESRLHGLHVSLAQQLYLHRILQQLESTARQTPLAPTTAMLLQLQYPKTNLVLMELFLSGHVRKKRRWLRRQSLNYGD